MKYYDDEERELIEWYEREADNLQPVGAEEKDRLKTLFEKGIAERQRKDARVNFRINSRDLALFKAKALEKGVNYQTLMTELVRDYIKSH
jgi:predicted DNA binding CopG/RHH family protein